METEDAKRPTTKVKLTDAFFQTAKAIPVNSAPSSGTRKRPALASWSRPKAQSPTSCSTGMRDGKAAG
jgi:hypothetical protein